MTGDGIYEAAVTMYSSGYYEFKVRADGQWAYSWSSYDEEYDRTENSQINLGTTLNSGEKLIVRLDTTKVSDEALATPDSVVCLSGFNFEESGYMFWPVTYEIEGRPLTNLSSISRYSANLCETVTIHCKAEGGKGVKQYMVLYQ